MKKNIKKLLSFGLAAALAASCMTGCNDKKTSDKDEQGRTILSVGHYPAAPGTDRDRFDEKMELFEAENSDVDVRPDEYQHDLKTFVSKAEGGQLPNFFHTYLTEAGMTIDSGYVADLTDALKKYGYDNKINPLLKDLVSRDGKVYGLPDTVYALGLAFNVKIFKQAGLVDENGDPLLPKTWQEVGEFSKIIKEKTGTPGFVICTTNNAGGWLFTPIAWSFGVEFMKQDENGKWKATFDSPEMVEALSFMKDLKWKYDAVPSNGLIDNATQTQTFATGGAAMSIMSPSFYRSLPQFEANNNDFGIAAIPAGTKRHVSLLGGSLNYCSANSTADQIDAAVRWYQRDSDYRLTDSIKKSLEDGIKAEIEAGIAVGYESLSLWSSDAEVNEYGYKLRQENATIDLKNVESYNSFCRNGDGIEVQAEEPVCAQELYSILDGCIQEVFTNKDADCAALVKKAASDFQSNYLDSYAN